jgi:hypothetical protein
MASTDFYLRPETLSTFYVDALKRDGHTKLVGWRSAPLRTQRTGSPQGVDVLTTEGRILRVETGLGGRVEVEDITAMERTGA